MHFQTLLPFVLAGLATAHTVPWVKGMYCINGTSHEDAPNTNTAVNPLYNLAKADWWFQHDRGCDAYPPDEGDILELPAGGSFEVQFAHNRAQTTLSYDGQFTSIWPDGKEHPEDWSGPGNPPECITDGTGALHTNNQTMAAGSAFAISYNSELSDVTSENLVVFTVAAHTPWKRLASFDVPAALPACPPGGCHCAWLWIPNGCGQPNMYMAGYRCNVTGATSTTPVAKGQTPVYCPDDASKCVKGAKQMVVWNQAEGNNVELGAWEYPTYSEKMGWSNGAQNDIFEEGATAPSVASGHTSAASTLAAASSALASAATTVLSSSSPVASSLPAFTVSSSTASPYYPVPSNSTSAAFGTTGYGTGHGTAPAASSTVISAVEVASSAIASVSSVSISTVISTITAQAPTITHNHHHHASTNAAELCSQETITVTNVQYVTIR